MQNDDVVLSCRSEVDRRPDGTSRNAHLSLSYYATVPSASYCCPIVFPFGVRLACAFDRTIPAARPSQWTDKEGKYTGVPGGVYETQLGVVAHSDGDVVYHSIVDAIFGALTLPDIGQVFQDTDPRWRGCDSSKFMEHAWSVMDGHGYRIGNCDVTLILERPKVATFKPAMKENIVSLLQTTPGRVNVKARTHEQVDSVGELRSLSCHVVLTLERTPEEEDKRKERKAPVFF